MGTDALMFTDAFWQDKLDNTLFKQPLTTRLHLILSLVIYLQVSIAQTLEFIFTSDIKVVKNRAARFMGYTATARDEDKKFPPGMIFRAWHERFPSSRPFLHKMISPCANEIVLEESNKLIVDRELQVKIKDLSLKSIKSLLRPGNILEKYQLTAPFTWSLMHTISASPNRHRKFNAKTENIIPDDYQPHNEWIDNPNELNDEPLRNPSYQLPLPSGFSRSPTMKNTSDKMELPVIWVER